MGNGKGTDGCLGRRTCSDKVGERAAAVIGPDCVVICSTGGHLGIVQIGVCGGPAPILPVLAGAGLPVYVICLCARNGLPGEDDAVSTCFCSELLGGCEIADGKA